MSLDGINWLAVLLATASAFLLGGIWYGPLFKRAWCRENGTDPDAPPKGHPGKVFGIAIAAAFVAATAFAMFLGPEPAPGFAVAAGLVAGLCWVAMSFGINYVFAGRSLKLWLIDGGYHVIQFALYGLILGLWH